MDNVHQFPLTANEAKLEEYHFGLQVTATIDIRIDAASPEEAQEKFTAAAGEANGLAAYPQVLISKDYEVLGYNVGPLPVVEPAPVESGDTEIAAGVQGLDHHVAEIAPAEAGSAALRATQAAMAQGAPSDTTKH